MMLWWFKEVNIDDGDELILCHKLQCIYMNEDKYGPFQTFQYSCKMCSVFDIFCLY
jgi:hypothetical protein